MDIFEYHQEQKKKTQETAEAYKNLAFNAISLVNRTTNAVSKYVGQKITEENLDAMRHDLISSGISEATAEYIVGEVRRQGNGEWDGNVTIDYYDTCSPFAFYDSSHGFHIPSRQSQWIVR